MKPFLGIVAIIVVCAFLSLIPTPWVHADTTTVGLDFNPSGTPANGAYDASLPQFETCAEVIIGQSVSIDVFTIDVSTLAAFEAHIQYNEAYLTYTGVNVLQFMASQVGSSVVNDTAANTLGDNRVVISAQDVGNLTGDTGRGVLARITFQGVASGISTVSIPQVDIDNNGVQDTGITLRKANGTLINDANSDGFFDGAWTPGPGVPTGTIAVGHDNDGDSRPSNTCPGGPVDNCPTVNNPGQEDLDSDGLGDACDPDRDGDFYFDVQETVMGSDPLNINKTPEVCDGIDNDLDGQTDENMDLNSNGIPDCNDATADTDSDGLNNTVDSDDDGDGLSDVREVYARTDSLRKCLPVGQHNAYHWFADTTGNRQVNILDVSKFSQPFNTSATNPVSKVRYDRRYDWTADGIVNIIDVSAITSSFNKNCP